MYTTTSQSRLSSTDSLMTYMNIGQPSGCPIFFLRGGVDGIDGINGINGKFPSSEALPIYPLKRSAPIYSIKGTKGQKGY